MDKFQAASICISIVALLVSSATAFFQYQSRQDAIKENIKIELKSTMGNKPLDSSDLRRISGVEERENLEAGILITNIGHAPVRILEAAYQDYDQPIHAFYADTEHPRMLVSGEQAFYPLPDVLKVTAQLTDDIVLGEDKKAKIFVVTTKGNKFISPAIIEVEK